MITTNFNKLSPYDKAVVLERIGGQYWDCPSKMRFYFPIPQLPEKKIYYDILTDKWAGEEHLLHIIQTKADDVAFEKLS